MKKKILGMFVCMLFIVSAIPLVEGLNNSNQYQNRIIESSLINDSPEVTTVDGFWDLPIFNMFGTLESMGNDSEIKVWFEFAIFSKFTGKKIYPAGDPNDEDHTRDKSNFKELTTTNSFMIEKYLPGFYFVYFKIQVFAEGLQTGKNISGIEKIIWPDIDLQVQTVRPIVHKESFGKYSAKLQGKIDVGGMTPRYGYFRYGRSSEEWITVDKSDVQGNPIPTDPLPQTFSYNTTPDLQLGRWRIIAFVEGTLANGETIVLHGYKINFLVWKLFE